MLPGWLKMNKMCSCSLLIATGFIPGLGATEKAPDMAFFEYLAELVEINGELVGPQDIALTKPTDKSKLGSELAKPAGKKDEKDKTPKISIGPEDKNDA